MTAPLYVYVTKTRKVRVASLEHASWVVQKHIWRNGDPILSSRWNGGMVVDAADNAVARVSYNGRVWSPEPWTPERKPELLMEATA